MRTRKFAFEIYWPLVPEKTELETLWTRIQIFFWINNFMRCYVIFISKIDWPRLELQKVKYFMIQILPTMCAQHERFLVFLPRLFKHFICVSFLLPVQYQIRNKYRKVYSTYIQFWKLFSKCHSTYLRSTHSWNSNTAIFSGQCHF